ncbi:MAG: DUF1146 domain-containing protein [Erysipelotrichales bacterium]|nr:DUF1146 domain-containing protein [Erysipelotrichales bacterium]
MIPIVRIFIMLATFALCLYALSALRLEGLFRKNSTVQIQLFYILLAMALAYLVSQYLFGLQF